MIYRYPGLEDGRRFEFTCCVCGTRGVSSNRKCDTCPPPKPCRAERARDRARKRRERAAARVMADLTLCSAEQAAAAQAAREGDKGAILGVSDWMAEEVIIRGGE